jgi:hypothetical protein
MNDAHDPRVTGVARLARFGVRGHVLAFECGIAALQK